MFPAKDERERAQGRVSGTGGFGQIIRLHLAPRLGSERKSPAAIGIASTSIPSRASAPNIA
jgi:hypothetical protein